MLKPALIQKLSGFAPFENGDKFLFNGESDPLEFISGAEVIGNMPRKNSLEIAKSPLGIGFETLDRDTFDPAKTFELLGKSGVKYARCQTGWMKCERVVGEYDFKWLDDIVDNLGKVGVEAWFSLSFGHPEHTPSPLYQSMLEQAAREGRQAPGHPRGWVGETPYLHGAEAMEAWESYVSAICRHFRTRVKIWEVWNEPDGSFWRFDGTPVKYDIIRKAQEYADFVRITAEVIRREIPDARVCAVVAQTGTAYIRALGEAGIGDVIDLFSYHFYEPVPELYMRERVAHIRANIRRSDGTPVDVIQGESGRASGPNAHFSFPTQLGQARYMARRYLTDFLCGAKMTSFFTVTDFICYYPDGSNQYYGILDAARNKPKLAYHTLCAMSWLFDGLETAPDYIAMLKPDARFYGGSWLPFQGITGAFRRKNVPLFAAWVPEHTELSMQGVYGKLFCLGEAQSVLADPVIIDPVRGKVWDASGLRLPEPAKVEMRGADVFSPFPLTNSPLILTDAAVFDEIL